MSREIPLLVASAIALSSCDRTESAADASPDPCTVAQAFITQELPSGGKFVLMAGPVQGNFEPHALEAVHRDMRKSPPPMQLLSDLAETREESVIARCPALAERMRKAGTLTGSEAGDAVVNSVNARGDYPAEIVTLSFPVVSEDGKSAVLAADRVSGGEAGGGAIYHLRRGGGGWRVVDWAGTWIA